MYQTSRVAGTIKQQTHSVFSANRLQCDKHNMFERMAKKWCTPVHLDCTLDCFQLLLAHGLRLRWPHPCISESPQTVSSSLENSPPGDLRWIKTQALFYFYSSVNTENKIVRHKKVNDFTYLQIFSSKGSSMFLCPAVKVQHETLVSFVVITVRWDEID